MSKVYTKNTSSIQWTIPITFEPTVFEFQLYNPLKMPISWAIKYNKCVNCTMENNSKSKKNNTIKNYGIYSNKCEHNQCIKITPTINLKVIII